ncbi:NAD(P)H-binding protein [Amycolatopsis cynarae]|uniref:NAD(P)H-binding protein n=1 Tax=Amycolatopsis cynarae TaxID=2995223 RepID=A0ABY7B369_9PSEU|nr:NAD(P)H-binding protein [Amycolatopsis sp. HUAS 11-8]WAL65889.1 NAD(P)H-binding protein [Amycolatopsis sp. HUAS 11-8]
MSRIVVFGAGGRAGRHTVAEAASRGHQVTAVVRDPDRHPDLAAAGVTVVAGDVTRPDSVAEVAAGHDAAVNAAVRLDVPSETFFPPAARALLDGLPRAGVARLVAIGIGTMLETAPGVAVHDDPGFPPEHRAFSLGHAAGLAVLRDADTDLDWVVLAPPPVVLDNEAARTGRYRTGGSRIMPTDSGSASFSYADLAVALIDEIETPKHHRALVAVAP